jgi:hypothetical protein
VIKIRGSDRALLFGPAIEEVAKVEDNIFAPVVEEVEVEVAIRSDVCL